MARVSKAQQERQWRAQEALATLQRAQEIQKDSRLMSDAKSLARKQEAALKKISGGSTRKK